MSAFNKDEYISEMRALLAQARANLQAQQPAVTAYTVNIWTDPDAACSAVNIDTIKNSQWRVDKSNRYSAAERERLLAVGDTDMAALFMPQSGRNANPADFAVAGIAECEHTSFPQGWEQASDGECWDTLEPALLEVGELARVAFADLPLHPEAELSVNSRRDWYDHTWALAATDSGPTLSCT